MKHPKPQLHFITDSGRILCGFKSQFTTKDRHTVTCRKCKKIVGASVKLVQAVAPTPIEEPADALELVARLKAKHETQKVLVAAIKEKLVIKKKPEAPKRQWHKKVVEETPAQDAKGKPMPQCTCGCGEFTKGGRFRPGHDARYYSQLKKEGADPRLLHSHGKVA